MRLDINLATHAYEDSRQFWLRWGTAVGVLGIVTLGLLIASIMGWYNARVDRKRISDLRAQIEQREQEQATAEAMLNRPENRVMREKSQYLNELIARKAFSWTQAIETLERLMPAKIHLVSIAPELNEQNELAIKMVVAGEAQERAFELVRKMEGSKHFRETHIDQIQQGTQAGAEGVQVTILALYVPTFDQEKAR
jgi:type IV pilus assembly protein PilN